MHHPSNRDPLDGPQPKWERRKSVPPQVPEDPWGHIPNRAHKVAKLTLSQSPVSSPSKTPDIQEPTITPTEGFIVQKLLEIPNRRELILACKDSSGEQFLVLSASEIDRVKAYTKGEVINPDHILFLLRKKLKITIS